VEALGKTSKAGGLLRLRMTLTRGISRVALVSLGLFVGSVATFCGQQSTLNLMPEPAQITLGQGRLAIDGTFRVGLAGYEEPRLQSAAQRLISHLARNTGIPLSDGLVSDASQSTLLIECDHPRPCSLSRKMSPTPWK